MQKYMANPNPQNPKGRLDRLSEELYSREAPSIINQKPNDLPSSRTLDVNQNWTDDKRLGELIGQMPAPKKRSFLKIFFLGSLGFFVVAFSVALFAIFGDFNNISSKNVDIGVLGPTSIGGGEELTLEIVIENKNNTTLETADLLIEYPRGTRVASDLQTELLRHRETLGRIESGANVRRTVRAVLFGEKDAIQNVVISVEYRVNGSNAVFSKEKSYEIVMASSPITLTATYPKEIASNKEFEVMLEAVSNSTTVIENALVRAEYPFGFSFVRSTPQPASSDSLWRLGDLKPGEKRTIKIRGKLEGQDNEERTFRFSSGISSERDENIIGAEFVTLLETVAIKKPGLGVELSLGGTGGDLVSTAGSQVSGSVRWVNNLPVRVVNGKIEVKLSGNAFNRSSVTASQGGFYRSLDNMIVWDRNGTPDLAEMAPGANGSLSFTFFSLGSSGGLPISNQSIMVEATALGTQLSGGTTPDEISSSITRKVNIASDIGLNTRIVYSIGSFANKGGIPPHAEKETTYTIIWTATNSSNDITGAVMKAQLPQYISWLSQTSPSQESISFDPIEKTVTWNIGELRAGTGFASTPREVSFQVSFVPSLSQVETTPDIISATTITGRDRFTSAFLEETKAALTTRLGTDPAFKNGDDKVKP